jgi:hypothetical protein
MGRLLPPFACALAFVVVACGGATPSASPTLSSGEPIPTDTASTLPEPEATATPDLVTELATGAWRRKPVGAPTGFAAAHEAGCRAALPAIGTQPLAVVDLRGEDLLTLVFGDMTAGHACWATLDDPANPLEVRPLDVIAGAPDGIDLSLYEAIDLGGTIRTFAIGRVGPLSEPREVLGDQNPAFVIAGFDDETFVWGAFANSWYAMWWPGVDQSDGVAITNGRNEVLDSTESDG